MKKTKEQVELDDINFLCSMSEEDIIKIAIVWGAKKLAWNRSQIRLSKDEIAYITTVSKAVNKCHPALVHFLNWKRGSIPQELEDYIEHYLLNLN